MGVTNSMGWQIAWGRCTCRKSKKSVQNQVKHIGTLIRTNSQFCTISRFEILKCEITMRTHHARIKATQHNTALFLHSDPDCPELDLAKAGRFFVLVPLIEIMSHQVLPRVFPFSLYQILSAPHSSRCVLFGFSCSHCFHKKKVCRKRNWHSQGI